MFATIILNLPFTSAKRLVLWTLILCKSLSAIFSFAAVTASSEISVAKIFFAPNLAAAIAKIPEPVPTSTTVDGRIIARSIPINANWVVLWLPVPKARPGSSLISCWSLNTGL